MKKKEVKVKADEETMVEQNTKEKANKEKENANPQRRVKGGRRENGAQRGL